jgi:hypothetical protein
MTLHWPILSCHRCVVGVVSAAQSWQAEAAFDFWGREKATVSLGSSSRVRGKATELLGWAPQYRSITDWIARELV